VLSTFSKGPPSDYPTSVNPVSGSSSGNGWGRVRVAYAALIADHDPWEVEIKGGTTDLRVGYSLSELHQTTGGAVLVSGPGDLLELREVVERMTGPATWPLSMVPSGFDIIETRTVQLVLERPASALGLIMSMEAHIEDRAGAWRTWKTTVESLAGAIPSGFRLSTEASLLGPTRR